MTHPDFHLGMTFSMGGGRWRVTDIGTRTVVAINLDAVDSRGRPMDSSWFVGPPYAVAEVVIDENDMAGCTSNEDG